MTNGSEAPINPSRKSRGYPGEPPKDDRNESVCAAYLAGKRITHIAEDFDLSPTRVRQIVDKRGLRKTRPKGTSRPSVTQTTEKVEKGSAYGPNVRKKSTKVCTRCGKEFTWIDTPAGWKSGAEYIPAHLDASAYPHWVDSDGTRWVRHSDDCTTWT